MDVHSEADMEQVLRAAMALVAAKGLKALTLRPLADKLDTTVSALSYRFGRKEALMGAVIEAARHQDGAFLDVWRTRVLAAGQLDTRRLADFADSILDDMARQHAARGQFYCELVQAAAWRPEIRVPLATWTARRLEFWTALAQAAHRPDLGEVLQAYSTDEGVHGLVLNDNAAYRWLRRLNLERLCTGLIVADRTEDLALFKAFRAEMGDLLGAADDRYRVDPMSEARAQVARSISALIIAEGADAVTHRAIAERLDIPLSTLAYRFPRQEDLLRAGLEDIILRLQGDVDHRTNTLPSEQSGADIARATFALALAATRMESLRGFAADMRRRRGENFFIRLSRETPGEARFDPLSAQAMSITGIGQVMLCGQGERAGTGFELIDEMRRAALATHRTSV